MGKWIRSPKARKYIYGVSIPVVALLVTTGIVSEEIAPQIIAIVTATLGFSLATVNTDPDQEK